MENDVFESPETHGPEVSSSSRPTLIRWSEPVPARSCSAWRCAMPGMLWVLFPLLFLLLSSHRHHHTNLWRIPGPPAPARFVADETPMMLGTWVGHFDVENSPALLVIDSQEGSAFDGTLVETSSFGTFKVRVHGDVEDGSRVSMSETDVLDTPAGASWLLGNDFGTLSADGLAAAGSGSDSHVSYSWSFSHVSATPFVPHAYAD